MQTIVHSVCQAASPMCQWSVCFLVFTIQLEVSYHGQASPQIGFYYTYLQIKFRQSGDKFNEMKSNKMHSSASPAAGLNRPINLKHSGSETSLMRGAIT